MTKKQVKDTYDDKGIVAHRLMEFNVNEKYKYIDGDLRCAATYINDAKGSSKSANVIFENNENVEDLHCLVQIRTLSNIECGEELLIDYGNKFYMNENVEFIQNKQVILLFLFFSQLKLKMK